LQLYVSFTSVYVVLRKRLSRAGRAVALLVFLAAVVGGATHKLVSAAEPIFKGDAWKFQRRARNSEVPLLRFAGVTARPTPAIAKDAGQTHQRTTTVNVARPEKPSQSERLHSFREEERTQHRHGTVELHLRRGTTRDLESDLTELFFLRSWGRLGEEDRKRPDDHSA
jgi:hypothetical protein